MKRSLLCLTLLLLLSGVFSKSKGQSVSIETGAVQGTGPALALYHKTIGPDALVFSGQEYQDYSFRFAEGHPYFISPEWTKGTVSYQGSTYKNVPLLYNLISDNLIVWNDTGMLKIQLVKEKVASFTIAGHHFVHACPNMYTANSKRCGFYDLMVDGTIDLLVKRTKNIQTVVTTEVRINAKSRDLFFLRKGDAYTQISRKKGLLRMFSDHKKEVKWFIRKNRIRYAAEPESAIVRIVAFYNQITG